jgi:uncharacterized repeat protein (TIGR01451 family)
MTGVFGRFARVGTTTLGFAQRRCHRTAWLSVALMLVLLVGPAPAPALQGDQLPDLVILPLRDIQVDNSSGRSLLRFTTIIANNGVGAFQVRGKRGSTAEAEMSTIQRIFNTTGGYRDVATPAKMFWAGDGHNHWHVRDLETTVLVRADTGVEVARIAKRGYCFYDNYRYKLSLSGAPQSPVYTGCGVQSALAVTMGLSVGWGDVYSYNLAYQYVDVTGLPDGRYRLISVADASNWFEETNENNNSTLADVQLGPSSPSADVSLAMSDSPDPVTVGSNLTYTMTVRNSGPSAASDVQVSDSVPNGATYVSSSWSQGSCSGTATVTCSLGSLASGANATVTLVVQPSSTGTLSNSATVSSSTADPSSGNNQASASTTVNATPPPPPPPPPTTTVTAYPDATTIVAGTVRAGDYTRLLANDNSYYQVNSSPTNLVSWTAHFAGVPNSLRSLRVTYSGSAYPVCNQAVSMLNTITGTYTTLDSRWVTSSEVLISPSVGGTLADYVSGTLVTGDVTVRVQCSTYSPFYVSGDLLAIVYEA